MGWPYSACAGIPAVLCGCNPTMLCGLLRKPGLGIKPQVEILGGDGVSVRKESTLVGSSGAARLPDEEMEEEEDREVTSASGAVCTLGVSTAKSASMRKFLDFSILEAGVRLCRLSEE